MRAGSPATGTATVAALSPPPAFAALLNEFADVTNKSNIKFAATPAHGVRHFISTTGPPTFARARQLDPKKLAAAKKEFDDMEKAGIIRRADGPWSSPLHLVKKADGSWRPTGDYRQLNNATVPDRYPLPNIRDFSAGLRGRRFFSKIDIEKGYYQVPMHPGDICKMAVIKPFGLYEWLVMPFGVRNAANTFQRMMDRMLQGLPFAFVYLDDILVASMTEQEHLDDVQTVLQHLQQFGLVINPDKSLFCRPSVEFLCHHVDSHTITPLSKHTTAIANFARPTTKKERFLGLINFYRRFLPCIAAIMKLTDALRGPSKTLLLWTPECDVAFEQMKQHIDDRAKLFHPVHDATISVAVDASDRHVGAVLQQHVRGGNIEPLSFYSRKLSSSQEKYSAFDLELLAAFSAIRYWRHLLEGRWFKLLTDHKPLVAALHRVSQPWSTRQQRQLAYLSEFDLLFEHISGDDNIVADALSQPPPSSTVPELATALSILACPGVDYGRMADEQAGCQDVQRLANSSTLTIIKFEVGGKQLLCDASTATP